MNEIENNPLHDLVRQTLNSYRPGYNPQDWEMLRQKLRRRRQKTGFLVLFLLVGCATGGWFMASNYFFATPKVAVTPAAPLLVDRYFAPRKSKVSRSKKVNKMAQSKTPSIVQYVAVETPGARLMIEPVDFLTTQSIAVNFLNAPPLLQEKSAALATQYEIIRQMTTGYFGPDSTTYKVLSRNLNQWPNAVIVCDFTSSMYPYSTQLFAWFRKNGNHKNIKGMVFFTDCDSTGAATSQSQKAGQMFVPKFPFSDSALPTLLAAARNTVQNEDLEENNVEALLFAQESYPDCERFILISDNGSGVKDLSKIKQVGKPVHVVICGPPADTTKPIELDYEAIARQTKGSLHTLEDDLNQLKPIPSNTWIRSGGYYYRYNSRKSRFIISAFRRRPVRFLGFFW